ncbi:hypothetical protein CJF42_00310 [Pseudoalteromonas sp. NBT06-2]|uniref:HvfC/BufC N-terminal domain-containing protein n=1 Tax=Pseudoalteromonas sp. NBT06-2 TaxID=2025950 RepID=UPI000BA5C954|nr:DNA-binding domain-containing protein [Pseudoalteromonas sp. NBT06-2]PAJ76379.1 hypothetical protein CJF42_00310 [Pseudoalteromonas sp. NBT06-2]
MPIPTELPDIEAWLQDCLIFQGDEPAHADALVGFGKLSASEHIDIYQRNYYARLLNCMREQFPALCFALGEELFNSFAHEYLVDCPSDSYTLYELGRCFASYLENSRPDRVSLWQSKRYASIL